MGCDSPLKGWKDRDTGGIAFRRERGNGEKMEVGCGQCLGCRLDYSRMWAMRCVHESELHEYDGGNCFVTLTYRSPDDCTLEQLEGGYHVPRDWSLNKKHFKDFMKRLRKYFPDQNIRYFYAGEYGRKCKHGIDVERVGCPLCNVGRPHYHALLFNCSFRDLEAYQSDGGIMRYTSPALERIWKYGFVDVGELNFSSASYVSRYIVKKIKGPTGPDHYMSMDEYGVVEFLLPEYVGMSRGNAAYKGEKCGIGAGWLEKYGGDVFPSDEVPVPGAGVMNGVPRYYDEILKDKNPAMWEQLKAQRLAFKREHSEEYSYERLWSKHVCKKARLNEKRGRFLS